MWFIHQKTNRTRITGVAVESGESVLYSRLACTKCACGLPAKRHFESVFKSTQCTGQAVHLSMLVFDVPVVCRQEDMQGFIKEQDILTLGVKVWHVLEYEHYQLSLIHI